MEADQFRCVHEFISEIIRKQQGVQVFAAACHIVLGCSVLQILGDRVKLRTDVRRKPQFALDRAIAFTDLVPSVLVACAACKLRIRKIQQIRHLIVAEKPLSRRGRHDELPRSIRLDNRLYFPKLSGICHGASAEFCHFDRHSIRFLF